MTMLPVQSPAAPAIVPAAGARPTAKVVGLDLSITATGIAYSDGTTATIKTKATDGDRRLLHIIERLTATLYADDLTGPDLVVIEEAPPGLRGAAVKAIHMVHGAVRLRLLDAGTPYAVVNPTTLKGFATGSTSADKTAMAMAAYKRAGREFPDSDQCDAWWLRAAGLDWLGVPEFDLPQAQRDRLGKAKWPTVGQVAR